MKRMYLAVAIAVGVTVGLSIGLGGYTFVYAKGASYLTTDPRACTNCHVMNEQYEGWVKSSHRDVATCADCHMPHEFIGKWTSKALNGFNQSLAFTTGNFPEPIRIGERNRRVTEGTCRSCHASIVAEIDSHAPRLAGSSPAADARDTLSCLRCHASVGHLH